MREKREDRESFKDSYQARCYRRNGSWLGDQKPGPGIEKSEQWPVGIANIDILAACLRFHRAQLRISERAEKREQSSDHPRQIDKSSRTDRLHHLGRDQKNSAPDDRSHYHGAGMGKTKIAC